MDLLTRRDALGGALALTLLEARPAQATVTNSPGDFAFLIGSWTVQHHKLKSRLTGESGWWDFSGTTQAWPLLGGAGNVDDNLLEDPNGAYRAATLRRFDPATHRWSIWWLDGRGGPLDPPVTGTFDAGVGTFYGDDTLRGLPIRVRFVWSQITAGSARWEQAFSPDAGVSWEVNWVMQFKRT